MLELLATLVVLITTCQRWVRVRCSALVIACLRIALVCALAVLGVRTGAVQAATENWGAVGRVEHTHIGSPRLAFPQGQRASSVATVGNAVGRFNGVPYDPTSARTARLQSIATKPGVAAGESGNVYRTGSRTDAALTDPTGVSFRESISSSADRVQVFKAGDKIYAVDTAKLPPGSVVRDGVPNGHVSIRATPDQIRAAIVDDPNLSGLGLKKLDDGSYRIPTK